MIVSIYHKLLAALNQAKQHNGNLMEPPEVILWPDPDAQWQSVIPELQKNLSSLLVYGTYEPKSRQGPAIWIKCMVARVLPEANWAANEIPVIYLPGISKNELKNVQLAGLDFQPMIEYQYTGAVFLQENGREWTIMAMLQNPVAGLGLRVAQDNATKEALKKALPTIFQDPNVLQGTSVVDAPFLHNQLFPDIIPMLLKWICKGDGLFATIGQAKKDVFIALCKSQYEFEPDTKNIKAIVEKLGSKRNQWSYVWQHYANAPHKYPELEDLLRMAKPADLGEGMFAFPEDTWPQVNEQQDELLGKELLKLLKLDIKQALDKLVQLEQLHSPRRHWVWYELEKAPMAKALPHLLSMAQGTVAYFASNSIDALKAYYIQSGYIIDQQMRNALLAAKSIEAKDILTQVIGHFYKPWLENITLKLQKVVLANPSIFSSQKAKPESETFVLFVDAFRYELAVEFVNRLQRRNFKISLIENWSAIPSLTPTAKANVAPIASVIDAQSNFVDFRPQLQSGRDLSTQNFRDALTSVGFTYVANRNDIHAGGKHWQEIGEIDKKGHEEQSGMVKRIEELFDLIEETIDAAFLKGINRIKIVTDHGWLLLPGGLPKTALNNGLAETRWGRCALIKEGAKTELLHLPWRWNPNVYIAYAPGISFFKANQEYAHGGISIHECLVPELIIEQQQKPGIVAEIKQVKWVNLKCTVITTDVPDGYIMDIRTKFNDAKTSILLSPDRKIKSNSITMMVDDAASGMSAAIVLMDEHERILDHKPSTVPE